ncbi:MAG: molecular chaperone HtpG [Bacteroidetes bacterium HGW-Bacteroidetes-4]|jgi:molecular chaperone HtpG|nr:MAG: molecular chaperone HtpG [Bacteroidetes bacterium HGW-Bacteroidetes-4]
MQKGKIGVTSENIFPIIKKFLYSDHEIFLREIVSNAVDATQKMAAVVSSGEYKNEWEDRTVRIALDKKKKTITISDHGIGMTAEEIDQYINQIAFSSAGDFLDKYKDNIEAIIGHFGLGFYSAFMVSEKVEILTKSYKEGSTAVRWSCDGSPEFTMEDAEKEQFGTDIILHIDKDNKEFLDESKINGLLNKYCKFLPVPIAFGKEQEWKDNKMVDTGKDKIINNTKPAWTKKPVDLKDEDYKDFYKELYPVHEDPLFHIHLNVDYPFNLTGILYFPKIKNNIEIQKNKIQLYSNQVFVTDSVEGIVPEFLTLLHGVIDSPDIPLNVSRSYLQSDSNVKKISSHISKKVADRLTEIFKEERKDFESKWDSLKLFIEYGMLSDEKFYDRAKKFALFKNVDAKYFTLEEYEKLIKENQTDKNKSLVYLYATDKEAQYSYIEAAKEKGYDVLLMDGQLDVHWVNQLEQKFESSRFVRVDSDVISKLIPKEDENTVNLSTEERNELVQVFNAVTPTSSHYLIEFEDLGENGKPMVITQSEFMRRMKDMGSMSGMNFYGDLPDSYNLVVNPSHPLVKTVLEDEKSILGETLKSIRDEKQPLNDEKAILEKEKSGKKDEEVSQEVKDKIEDLTKKINALSDKENETLKAYGKESKLAKQLVDLALLANNMLKGEDLNRFVARSIELIK